MSSPVHPNGRLTKNPELRFTNGGKAIAQFNVVTARRYKDGDQWQEKDVSFWDCTAFGEMAENICENLHKGDAVLVTGEMRQESWEKDGKKNYAWRVLVSDVGPSLKWQRKPADSNGSSSSYNDEPPF